MLAAQRAGIGDLTMGATVELKYPGEADGRKISTLTMRRPKVRDERDARRQAGDNDAEHEIVPLANLCEVAPETIHELDLQD